MNEPVDTSRTREPIRPEPVKVNVNYVIAAGTAGWVIALIVILAVPALHQGQRSWWPWVPVISIGLGVLAWVYIRRGRGNATAA